MAAAGYLWHDPGDPITIQMRVDLVERLGAAIEAGLGDGARGMEIGGLLLGRFVRGAHPEVLVEDFEPMPCEHSRGFSYTLSKEERQALGARLKRHKNRTVVGFFRCHTRLGLYMDQDDLAVFSQYFADPSQVFLLVRPAHNGPAVGGFFFWEDGDINRRAPYRQFPFEYKALGATSGATPRLAPVRMPKPAPHPARKLPPLSSMAVPAIATLFLIAALFVSSRDTKLEPQQAKAVTAVEPLLPEPVPEATVTSPPPPARVAEQPGADNPATVPPGAAPVTTKPAGGKHPPVSKRVLALPPTTRPLPRLYQLDAPPRLTASASGAPLANILPPSNPPPSVAEVTCEAPHAGVFRRAFRKIAAEDYVPPSPTLQVAPVSRGNGGMVDVKVFIDESGSVTRAQVLTKGSNLADAAVAAARQWRFTPALKHDQPAASEMLLHFRF